MKRLVVAALAAAVLGLALPGVANAAKPSRILATPHTACTILVQYGAGGYGTYRECMANLRRDITAFRFPSDEDPSVLLSLFERCRQFEDEFLTYPFTFEEGPDWPLPVLTAQNRQQCATTLFTYHELAEALFGEE
jgi:hypothetical protein